jgi:acetylornithine/N-succinyldiaminopimelate aminotransferase
MAEKQFLLQNYGRLPITAASGEGCYLIDTECRRYLDAISGIGVNALGYNHPRILSTLIEQAQVCIHTSNLVFNPWQEPLAEKLCAISGMERAFFSNSGTEAMEAALKAARVHARAAGQTARVVALRNSFHGRTFGSLAVTGQPKLRCAFEPFGGEVTFVEPNDLDGLARAFGPDAASIVLEPVLGEGGIIPLDARFLQCARDLTAASGALLIVDETQCGLGRTGKHFAFQWAGIQPDIVVTAKPLAAGLPLGATLFSESAAQCLPVHSHGSTFGGGPLACRVALEFLAIVDELLPHIRAVGAHLRARLEDLRVRHSAITGIRSSGMMFGIQLSRPGTPVVLEALERGLIVNCTQDTVIRLLPPYILTTEQADTIVEILDEALQACQGGFPSENVTDSVTRRHPSRGMTGSRFGKSSKDPFRTPTVREAVLKSR